MLKNQKQHHLSTNKNEADFFIQVSLVFSFRQLVLYVGAGHSLLVVLLVDEDILLVRIDVTLP